MPLIRDRIGWQTGQQLKRPSKTLGLLAQDNLFATAENLDFLRVDLKLLGQSDGLRITAAEYAGSGHRFLAMYIHSVYTDGKKIKCDRQVTPPR